MIIDKNTITSFIPQRNPFVMIDNLIAADENGFESNFYLSGHNLFNENGTITEPALIENIAQTCAAGFGYLGCQSNEKPSIGYIGSISKLTVYELPQAENTIHTQVTIISKLGNIFLIRGQNSLNGQLLLECEMKIALA
jgi:predicted hotdog family 3-hydroxylacyl-ACP dehydratase